MIVNGYQTAICKIFMIPAIEPVYDGIHIFFSMYSGVQYFGWINKIINGSILEQTRNRSLICMAVVAKNIWMIRDVSGTRITGIVGMEAGKTGRRYSP